MLMYLSKYVYCFIIFHKIAKKNLCKSVKFILELLFYRDLCGIILFLKCVQQEGRGYV